MMPLPLFYDFDAQTRADALVTAREARGDEDELYDRFETLHEMLSWGALYRFRLSKMPQTCTGTFRGEPSDIQVFIERVMDSLGFSKPISTGSLCGLYERADAVMICKGIPRHEFNDVRSFNLGGASPGVLRKILGELAMVSALEVKVAEWSPALA
ncbi:hypothetical protein HPC49_45015 [Pyxidicoccus fallax]|uniref:Uncharacterized protein n=2 Tax=Pyxidicoccus fallax TaxID=394095 RepID=A0A848LH16_9BACT|nr:hypothetical protein [Pyxidicoccus fallax]NPC85344.1 hypothetical protein [Pyxidicoccus fallax]